MNNALTIDVEDYRNILGRDWLNRDGPPTEAVVSNTRRMLAIFAEFGVRGTFFVLGEVAKTFPQLMRDIAGGGHELGVHGFYHRQVFKLSPEEFRREVADAKAVIEDAAGAPAPGHRAPAFSIMPKTSWALDVLAETGFEYDSSIFPFAGRRYGWPEYLRDIHTVACRGGRSIIECPLSTVTVLGRRMPSCGGGYLRHFPGRVTHWSMRRVQRERPAVLYLHPYEFEPGQAEFKPTGVPWSAAMRMRFKLWTYMRNRSSMEPKLRGLLSEFQFAPMGDVIRRSLQIEPQGNARIDPAKAGPKLPATYVKES